MKVNRINQVLGHITEIKSDIKSHEDFLDVIGLVPCMNSSCGYEECDICNDPEISAADAYNNLQNLYSALDMAKILLEDAINFATLGL